MVDILDTEPFNENLDRRIWSLNAERMALEKELGDRRRKMPLDMERLIEDMLLDEPPSLNGDEGIINIDMPDEGIITYIYMLIFFFLFILFIGHRKTTAGGLFEGTVEIIENLDQVRNRVIQSIAPDCSFLYRKRR